MYDRSNLIEIIKHFFNLTILGIYQLFTLTVIYEISRTKYVYKSNLLQLEQLCFTFMYKVMLKIILVKLSI